MLATKHKGSVARPSKDPLHVGGGSLQRHFFMTFKKAAFSSMLLKNLCQPIVLAGVLVGGATMYAGSAHAVLYSSTCSFTALNTECIGLSNTGWSTTGPDGANPRKLGDKLLVINNYDFGDFTNAGTPIKASGIFQFSWLDELPGGPSPLDFWNVRTSFTPNAVSGDQTNPLNPLNALGTLNYTLTITDPGAEFASVELDSGHIGSGSTVTKIIPGFASMVSFNGASSTQPLSGTSVNVTDTYSVAAGAGLEAFNNGFTQSVPGPLPLLGAGVAFGFSRKLRQRITTPQADSSRIG